MVETSRHAEEALRPSACATLWDMATIDITAPEDLARRYAEDGFVVLPDVLDAAALDELRAETLAICSGERGAIDGVQPVAPGAGDDEILSQYVCVHHPHKISDVARRHLATPAVVDTLTTVIGPNVKCMQSMLFIKSAGKPGQAWHQDEAFIPTRDRSLTAAWVALDDATVDNGCLWVIPGSHRSGVLWAMREQEDERFDCSDESFGFPYTDDDAVPVEVPAGSALLFDGYLLHRSLPNRTTNGLRRALVNHYMSAESLLPWRPPTANEWMGIADVRDVVLVAGRDPYAYKGTHDIEHAHVRPERAGGCKPTSAPAPAAAGR